MKFGIKPKLNFKTDFIKLQHSHSYIGVRPKIMFIVELLSDGTKAIISESD